MKYALASYCDNGSRRAALVVDETLYDLADAFGADAPSWAKGSLDDVVAHWEEASDLLESLESMSKPSNPLSAELDAPLRPTRIFAAASNYVEHADEMSRKTPSRSLSSLNMALASLGEKSGSLTSTPSPMNLL